MVHSELLAQLRLQGRPVEPGTIGENITTAGLDLLALPQVAKLHIGASAIVVVTGLRNPCSQLDNYSSGLTEAVLGRAPDGQLIRKAGIMGVVEAGGTIVPGDAITVVAPTGAQQPLKPV